jgi:hypothetical protein
LFLIRPLNAAELSHSGGGHVYIIPRNRLVVKLFSPKKTHQNGIPNIFQYFSIILCEKAHSKFTKPKRGCHPCEQSRVFGSLWAVEDYVSCAFSPGF